MWSILKKLINDCLTETDGKTYCPFRVGGFSLSAAGIPTFLGLAVYAVVKSAAHQFDMIGFGTAFGAMMTGLALLAGGVAVKAKGETPAGDSSNPQ